MQPVFSSLSSKIWRCQVCGHMEMNHEFQCGECSYLRLDDGDSLPWIQAESPRVPSKSKQTSQSTSVDTSSPSASDESPDEHMLVELAFTHLQRLFERARVEGHTLDAQEQADVYRSLLDSFLKLERQKIRHFLFDQETEIQRQQQLRKLSLVWFLGITFGFIFAYVLGIV
jgi:hypothetical protein